MKTSKIIMKGGGDRIFEKMILYLLAPTCTNWTNKVNVSIAQRAGVEQIKGIYQNDTIDVYIYEVLLRH